MAARPKRSRRAAGINTGIPSNSQSARLPPCAGDTTTFQRPSCRRSCSTIVVACSTLRRAVTSAELDAYADRRARLCGRDDVASDGLAVHHHLAHAAADSAGVDYRKVVRRPAKSAPRAEARPFRRYARIDREAFHAGAYAEDVLR